MEKTVEEWVEGKSITEISEETDTSQKEVIHQVRAYLLENMNTQESDAVYQYSMAYLSRLVDELYAIFQEDPDRASVLSREIRESIKLMLDATQKRSIVNKGGVKEVEVVW